MTAVPALPISGSSQPRPGSPPGRLHEPCVLLKLGEVILKGKNRQQFERLLQNNIRLAVADLGLGLRLWQRDGVIVLSPVLPPGNCCSRHGQSPAQPRPAGPARTASRRPT